MREERVHIYGTPGVHNNFSQCNAVGWYEMTMAYT